MADQKHAVNRARSYDASIIGRCTYLTRPFVVRPMYLHVIILRRGSNHPKFPFNPRRTRPIVLNHPVKCMCQRINTYKHV